MLAPPFLTFHSSDGALSAPVMQKRTQVLTRESKLAFVHPIKAIWRETNKFLRDNWAELSRTRDAGLDVTCFQLGTSLSELPTRPEG